MKRTSEIHTWLNINVRISAGKYGIRNAEIRRACLSGPPRVRPISVNETNNDPEKWLIVGGMINFRLQNSNCVNVKKNI
jgi:hypothetical protein